MYNIFIESTCEIIKEEGIKQVTARKIGDRAGYTSSTIYNYFDELSHLVFFAAMNFLESYNDELENSLISAKSAREKFFITWEVFCRHSFHNPDIFYAVFVSDLGIDPNELIKRYYQIYENKIVNYSQEAKFIILEHDLYKRNAILTKELLRELEIDEKKESYILQTAILIWQGLLVQIINNRTDIPPEKCTENYIHLLDELIQNLLQSSK